MWLRFKNWQNISDQEQTHVVEIGFRRYFFWKKDGGICDVQVKSDVERMLNPKNIQFSAYEVAYEKYGIYWNEKGAQIEKTDQGNLASSVSFSLPSDSVTSLESPNGSNSQTLTTSTAASVEVPPKPKISFKERISKMQAARNRNRIARGEPPIDFGSTRKTEAEPKS